MKTLSWLVLALPLAALAQEEVPGIDLSAPQRPRESRPTQTAPAQKEKEKEKRPPGALETAVGVPGERDAALGDRVKAVQRKGFLKQHRLQLTGFFSPSVNDAFYQKFGFGARLAYNFADSFAAGVRYTEYAQVQTQYRREAALAFNSLLLASRPYRSVMAEGIWSPVYGKVAVGGSSIIHFDLFLAAGGGLAWSATSFDTTTRTGQGAHLATEFGGGVRFYPASWLAFEAGVMATLYPDQTDPNVPAGITKIITATVGLSLFYPFGFEYVYP